ncbi:MAG: hypothetical protein WBV73_10695 [Phormidium sp.]
MVELNRCYASELVGRISSPVKLRCNGGIHPTFLGNCNRSLY